ncbi:hypothetical protein POTOM_012825 [Populus tomentosa]|uniref:Uncharacterized protein n=1 Tax=Populus tomentosa TaxID=118781 RepID=A0A8X8AFE1_POPTO|nr:hypothetical protein POTOM_012825 [Populus tomentosa]
MNNISFLCWVTVTMERNLNLVYIVVGLVIALFSVLEKERPPQKELNGIECMKNQIRAACGVRQPCMKIRQKPGFDAHQMIRLYSLSSQVSTASADTLLLFVNYTINYENIYYTNNSELLVIWMDMFLFYRINPP